MADDVELKDLLEQMGAEAQADFREPQYSFGHMLRAVGGDASFVRNWIDRGTLTLDADLKRVEGKHRRFSYRDAVLIALAIELSRQGIAPSNAERAAELMSDFIEEDLGVLTSHATVRLDFSVNPPAIVRHNGPGVGIGPCVGIVIDIFRLQGKVATGLAGRIIPKTVKYIRRRAAKMERAK